MKASEEAAAQALAAAQAAESGSNAVETTSKAALAALRCSQVNRSPSSEPDMELPLHSPARFAIHSNPWQEGTLVFNLALGR